MQVKIVEINEKSKFLKDVVDIGDKNNEYLGFFPKSAYKIAAQNGQILIAISSQQECLGYLLYREVKTKQRISITHLCVKKESRGHGTGRKLVEFLVDKTRKWQGIGLYCRKDYEANKFWSRIGFQYFGEKQGRGKDKVPLFFYWYDHGHPSLEKYKNKIDIQSKTNNAVIDMNVFISLFENKKHPLNVDWLLEDLNLSISAELRNEISRDNNTQRRKEMFDFSRDFSEIVLKRDEADKVKEFLSDFFISSERIQDYSDLTQLSQAISSGSDFFITNDYDLVKKLNSKVYSVYGLQIITPEDLIIHFDELLNKTLYQSQQFAGTQFQIARFNSGESELITDSFHYSKGISKNGFRRILKKFLLKPEIYKTFVIRRPDQDPIAFIVFSLKNDNILEIPLICAINSSFSPALESYLVFQVVKEAIKNQRLLIRITDNALTNEIETGLLENSFRKINDVWLKINLEGLLSRNELEKKLLDIEYNFSEKQIMEIVLDNISEAFDKNKVDKAIQIEKILWPLKIKHSNIETYVVPIKPNWAMDLFDTKLGSQTLFGSNPNLMFKLENVYYRSPNTSLPKSMSRILWYVSKGYSNDFQNVMAIRACSYVEEVQIGFPKDIYKKFNKLGVYDWEKVLSTSYTNSKGKVLAFRFSRTELFKTPIYLKEYKKITGNNCAPIAPTKIKDNMFNMIYKIGMRK